MNTEPLKPEEDGQIVEVESQSEEITTNELRQETIALIEAIRTKAQSETHKLGEFTRQNYLDAVRKTRAEVEKLNLEPAEIESAFKQIQTEVEKNWEGLVKQVHSVGDRLQEAAKAAWETLTAPKDPSEPPK